MKKIKITQFADPGHSWFSVKRKLLEELDLLDKISACSYQRGETVYLEEDCDFAHLIKAVYIRENGSLPENWHNTWMPYFNIKKSHTNKSSPIRSYSAFRKVRAKVEVGAAVKLYGKSYTILEVSERVVVKSQETGDVYRLKKTQLDALSPCN